MPVNILKLIKGIICKPLEILFNSSLLTGCVPDCFKMARVIPVHKKGSTVHCNNYRPISLLSIFNKLLEKLVFNRISCFIEKHNILYNKQFGFHAKHSTLHVILSITDQIQTAVETAALLFLLYINDMKNTTSDLDIHLFADDSNLFCSDKSLSRLETRVNAQLSEVYRWLCANKLSLNIEKSNYIILHSIQRKLNYKIKVFLNNQILKREFST